MYGREILGYRNFRYTVLGSSFFRCYFLFWDNSFKCFLVSYVNNCFVFFYIYRVYFIVLYLEWGLIINLVLFFIIVDFY